MHSSVNRFVLIAWLFLAAVLSGFIYQVAVPSEEKNQVGTRVSSEKKLPSSDAAFGLLGALLGAVVGVAGSLAVLWRTNSFSKERDLLNERSRQKSVRTTLATEVEMNWAVLREDYEYVKADGRPNGKTGFEWLALNPCPVWNTAAWASLAGSLYGALASEEIRAVQRFYGDLNSISAARRSLADLHLQGQVPAVLDVSYSRATRLIEKLLDEPVPLSAK